jgi:spore germination cell wall hydrolase CwlJ-like protein
MIAEGILCLALNIFHEARSEPIQSQVAVAAITMNRVNDKEHPSSICKVVYEPSAFSWTQEFTEIIEPALTNDIEKKAYLQAKQIASLYIQGKLKNPIGSRKYFNHKSLGKRHNTPYRPIRFSKLVYY